MTYRAIEEETLDAAGLARLQQARLEALLRELRASNAFYQAKFAQCPAGSAGMLHHLPLTTRAEIERGSKAGTAAALLAREKLRGLGDERRIVRRVFPRVEAYRVREFPVHRAFPVGEPVRTALLGSIRLDAPGVERRDGVRFRAARLGESNVRDPVALSPREAVADVLAFEIRDGAAQPRLVDVFEGVDVDDGDLDGDGSRRWGRWGRPDAADVGDVTRAGNR